MKQRAHHRNEMPLEKQQMFIKQVNIVISMSRLLGFDTFTCSQCKSNIHSAKFLYY